MAINASPMDLLQRAGDAAPLELSPPLQALWWLRKGGFAMGPDWEKAHAICQTREGERDYDLVHALAHWIEGDMGNADYWYARVGEKRAASVEREWARIAGVLARA
jgi:hypothetical protein